MHRAFRLVILVLSLAVAASLTKAEINRLSDRVIFVRDKPGSGLKFQMIINAGCLDEAGSQCRGLAHYLEHIVLVGRNPQHKDAAVRLFGDGGANGWTSERATVYVHSAPARAEGPRADLEKLFEFYAARLRDFAITDEDAARERNVVLQEHDWRVQSNPYAILARDRRRRLLPDHPSGQWVIGTREDIQGFTVEAARAFHRNWYAINNAWFVVSADAEPAIIKEIADKALAGLPNRDLPHRNFSVKPALATERLDRETSSPTMRRAGAVITKVVRISETDRDRNRAARLILGNFLTSQLPGSLFEEFIEKRKLAVDRPFASIERVAPETFVLTIGLNAAPGVEPAALLDAVVGYLGTLPDNPGLSDEALARLKRRFVQSREDIAQDPAREYLSIITWLANRNEYEKYGAWPGVVGALVHEDVRALARGFAAPGRMVTDIITVKENTP